MERLTTHILDSLSQSYREEEFPALLHQVKTWGESKPLLGLSILDASPIFFNTFAKYAALIEAGASLRIGMSSALPSSPQAIDFAKSLGIPLIHPDETRDGFDIILDCAAEFRNTPSKFGYVELTRSGVHLYESVHAPVWAVDSGRIKQIETSLGTGDGFIRAMKQLGFTNWQGRQLMVFGYGKVGKGIVLQALKEGAHVTVIDICSKREIIPAGVDFISLNHPEKIQTGLENSFCAVTSTGIKHALQGIIDEKRLMLSPVLLANMGVEDEWGENIPEARVLNGKKPLNFILHDPTSMCYIDPALALHNAGAVELATRSFPPKISIPAPELEQEYIRIISERGIIRREMAMINLV